MHFSFMNIIADQSEKATLCFKIINEYSTVEIELFTHNKFLLIKIFH